MKVTIAIIFGFILGVTADYTARLTVKKRYDKQYSKWYLNKRFTPFGWGIVFAIIIVWQWVVTTDYLWLLRLSVIVFACAVISATDILIRKVPNSMLFLLIINSIVFLFIDKESVKYSELIMAVILSVIIFRIPSLLNISVGFGDVKLAVVAALLLSLRGFLQAMILMGIGFLISAVYLVITKKGNLKTQIPMGPFITFGMVFTSVYPLF